LKKLLYSKGKRFFVALVFFLLVAGGGLAAAEDPSKIVVEIGERKTVDIDGVSPFVADDSVLGLEEITTSRVRLTGVAGGITQIFFWKDGLLKELNVEVTVPPLFSSQRIGPQFKSNKTYFVYDLQNSSSFSKDGFFIDPIYSHSLTSETSFLGGKRLRSLVQFQHRGNDSSDITNGSLLYEDRGKRVLFGNASTSLTRVVSEALSGASFLGSEIKFRNPFGPKDYQRELNFFGGIRKPRDFLDIAISQQIYGANYSFFKYLPNASQPNLANMSFFSYQSEGSDSFHIGAALEGIYYIKPSISLASGIVRGEGGIATVFAPTFENKNGSTFVRYLYINHGLRAIGGTPFQNDEHRYQIRTQHLFSDKISQLEGSVFHSISLKKGDSDIPTNDNFFGQVAFRRGYAFHNSYGLQYGFGRSDSNHVTSISNTLAGNYTHSINQESYFTHSLGYSRSDQSSSSNQINATSSFNVENEKFRSASSVTGSFFRGTTNNESLFILENMEWQWNAIVFKTGFSYQKANIRDSLHQIIFSPTVSYRPTSVHSITMNSSAIFSLGNRNRFNGNLGLNYQYFFGPGIESDSLLKKIMRKRARSNVEGDLFLDKNYDSYLDNDDLPLVGIPILLDGKETKTDDKGHFIFPLVKEGAHELQLDDQSLGIDYPIEVIKKQSFYLGGKQTYQIPIPVTHKKASISVKCLIDVNTNGIEDGDDTSLNIPKVLLEQGSIQREIFANLYGFVIKGVALGEAVVDIDPMDVPEGMDILGPYRQRLVIEDDDDYSLTFLFSPLRSIRGQVIMPKEVQISHLRISYGEHSSTIDKDGYYWIQDLSNGNHILTIHNLPSSVCIREDHRAPLHVPKGSFFMERQINLTTDCSYEKDPPSEIQINQ
jgi:hypothetical protein